MAQNLTVRMDADPENLFYFNVKLEKAQKKFPTTAALVPVLVLWPRSNNMSIRPKLSLERVPFMYVLAS